MKALRAGECTSNREVSGGNAELAIANLCFDALGAI
jgi:hypothetical protein